MARLTGVALFTTVLVWCAGGAAMAADLADCRYNGIALMGEVEIVDHFADIKVEIVDHFADINVERVDNFADDCGEWEIVDNFGDFTIELVDNFGGYQSAMGR